ncbi:hypothetical protein [Parahaliea mediterranea]|nr:hypothetical protein [Parahaliea mediterranea]
MTDYGPLIRARAARRRQLRADCNGIWIFATGFGWGMVFALFVLGLTS